MQPPRITPRTHPLRTRQGTEAGTFTLTPIPPDFEGHVGYLVQVDRVGLAYFAGPRNAERYADKTIGALTKIKNGWAVTAYLDRGEYMAGRGVSWHQDARNQEHGVRLLLTFWWLHHHPERTVEQLTDKECRRI